MPPRSTVLPFPERDDAPEPASSSGPTGVHISPMVGYNAVELTYFDSEHIPRIRIQLDTTVPQDVVQRAKRWMELTGDQLPALASPRLLGPRLVRG